MLEEFVKIQALIVGAGRWRLISTPGSGYEPD